MLNLLGLAILLGSFSLTFLINRKDSRQTGIPLLERHQDIQTMEKENYLGTRLFYDTRLSKDNKISCASCHQPNYTFADNLKTAKGISNKLGARNTPTLFNVAFYDFFGWDGGSSKLEDQVIKPITNPVEMGLESHEDVVMVINSDDEYIKSFSEVFKISANEINIQHIGHALASHVRNLRGGNSKFDRWYFKKEQTLSEQEIKGFEVFKNKGRCIVCHKIEENHALFTDNLFHNNGVGISQFTPKSINAFAEKFILFENENHTGKSLNATPSDFSDLGRFLVTKNIDDIGAFRTPSLRNVSLTPPYMHDGSIDTIEEVVQFYNDGGQISGQKTPPYLSEKIKKLNLTDSEKNNLVLFLKTLNSEILEQRGNTNKLYR